jgi:hypothetical protein
MRSKLQALRETRPPFIASTPISPAPKKQASELTLGLERHFDPATSPNASPMLSLNRRSVDLTSV